MTDGIKLTGKQIENWRISVNNLAMGDSSYGYNREHPELSKPWNSTETFIADKLAKNNTEITILDLRNAVKERFTDENSRDFKVVFGDLETELKQVFYENKTVTDTIGKRNRFDADFVAKHPDDAMISEDYPTEEHDIIISIRDKARAIEITGEMREKLISEHPLNTLVREVCDAKNIGEMLDRIAGIEDEIQKILLEGMVKYDIAEFLQSEELEDVIILMQGAEKELYFG